MLRHKPLDSFACGIGSADFDPLHRLFLYFLASVLNLSNEKIHVCFSCEFLPETIEFEPRIRVNVMLKHVACSFELNRANVMLYLYSFVI